MGINTRATTLWLGSLVLLLIVAFGLVKGLMAVFSETNPHATATRKPVTVPVAHAFAELDVNQPQQLLETRETAHHLLSEYAWLDRSAGVARIPIGRAMDILAHDGLPVVGGPSGEEREHE